MPRGAAAAGAPEEERPPADARSPDAPEDAPTPEGTAPQGEGTASQHPVSEDEGGASGAGEPGKGDEGEGPEPTSGAPTGEDEDKEADRFAFRPAPKLPAPFRPVKVTPGFDPVAAIPVEAPKKKGIFGRKRKRSGPEAVEEERVERDQTPTAVYYTILFVSLFSFFVGFLFWNSSSIGAAWRLGFFIEMVLFGILILVIGTRLGRRQHWGTRIGNFFLGIVLGFGRGVKSLVDQAKHGITSAGKGVTGGAGHLKEGFKHEGEPNIIVKGIQKLVKLVTNVIVFAIRIVLGVFGIIAWAWATVVRIGWILWNGIVWPVLNLAVRIARWALRVVWRVGRWALKVSWKIVYWFLRWWPVKYVTNLLKEPVREWAEPKVLTTNVVVSDLLLAPVKEETRQKAEPYVAEYRHQREVQKAVRLLEKAEEHEELREEHQKVLTPEERKRMREERKQRKAEAKEREAREKKEAAERAKEEKAKAKEEKKARKEALAKLPKEERKKVLQEEKERAKAEREAEKARQAMEAAKAKDEALVAKGKEPKHVAKLQEQARAEEEKRRAKEEEKRFKEELEKLSKPERKKRLQEHKEKLKAEKKAEKERAKEEKAKAKEEAKAAKENAKAEKAGAKEASGAKGDDAAAESKDKDKMKGKAFGKFGKKKGGD